MERGVKTAGGDRIGKIILFAQNNQIDGEYTGKRRFIIFDYCNNFEFFGTKTKGYEGREAKSLSEMIYGKRIRLITAFQKTCFSEEAYRNWRNELVEICCKQAGELNDGLISVKLKRKFLERYGCSPAGVCKKHFQHLSMMNL